MYASLAPHANCPDQSNLMPHSLLLPPTPPPTPLCPHFGSTPIPTANPPRPRHLTPITGSDHHLNSAGNRNSYQTLHSSNYTPTPDNAFPSSSHVMLPSLTFFYLPKSTQPHYKTYSLSTKVSHATTMTPPFTHSPIASIHPPTAIPSLYVAAGDAETTFLVPPNGQHRYLVILQDTPPALLSSSHGYHKVLKPTTTALLCHPASASSHPLR